VTSDIGCLRKTFTYLLIVTVDLKGTVFELGAWQMDRQTDRRTNVSLA